MANEYLTRTYTSTGNLKVGTFSFWIKGRPYDTNQTRPVYLNDGSNLFQVLVERTSGTNPGQILIYGASANIRYKGVYRDPSAWSHYLIKVDNTTNGAEARFEVYVNGVKLEIVGSQTTSTASYPARDANVFNNVSYINGTGNGAFQCYDYFYIDGQALTPDVFGFYKDGDGYISAGSTQATDFRPGQWVPKTPRVIKAQIERNGGFGVNGFYLPMNDSSNFGADFHTTPNSIITLKGEDLPQPRNGAPTTTDSYVSQLRPETGTLGFDGCIKLDGNQGLSIADTADLDLGTGDFTIEGFYYLKNEGTYHALFDFRGSGGDGLYPALFKDETENKLYFYENAGVEIDDIPMRHDEWMHVAICRSSGTTRAFVDGKLGGSFSDSNNYISRDLYIGQSQSNSNDLYGFVSNFRIVKGTALYTSNFTPPTSPLENVTNTILLCANSSTSVTASTVTPSTISTIGSPIATRNELTGSLSLAVPGISGGTSSGYGDYSADIKGSGSNKTLTANGNAGVAVTASYYGSALSFDGSGDFFSMSDNDDFNFGSGDFTVEAWIKTDTPNGRTTHVVFNQSISAAGSDSAFYFGAGVDGASLYLSTSGSSWTDYIESNVGISTVGWVHQVWQKRGTYLELYTNGVAVGIKTNFSGTVYNSTRDVQIGVQGSAGASDFDGYIQDLRVYKGVAKYKGGFDVPKPYTPVGIESWRAVPDTTANNFATLNALAVGEGGQTYSEGNLKFVADSSSAWHGTVSTIGVSTGKWYVELLPTSVNFSYVAGFPMTQSPRHPGTSSFGDAESDTGIGFGLDGTVYTQGSATNKTNSGYSQGDYIGLALDLDNRTVDIYANGSDIGGATSIDEGTYYFGSGSYTQSTTIYNFGQNPTFSGNVAAGTFTDSNGKGLFKYEPPSGFLALCEDNLPTPAIKNPGEHFKTVLYTGDGNNGRSITGVGFQPDFVWNKERSSTSWHNLVDSVRGSTQRLYSNEANVEGTTTNSFASFNSDGFSIGDDGGTNQSGQTYVAWCWKAGGAAVSNSDGSINSVVSVNQDAGFSIISYTGNGTSGATIGHGLDGKTPGFIIVKNREAGENWQVGHKSLGWTKRLFLDLSADEQQPSSAWNDTAPSSSVITLGNGNLANQSSKKHIAYCWAEIEGFSKFGSYIGNGNADGSFVYCGFKPAWVLVKRTTPDGYNWTLFDNARKSTNPVNCTLNPNNNNIEETSGGNGQIDFLSNGFKCRNTDGGINGSGGTYIFAAFAESPFQTANAK